MPFNITDEYSRIIKTRTHIQGILGTINVHTQPKFKLPTDVKDLKDLRIVCILDDFSFNFFKPECNISQLDPRIWKKQIESLNPHMLLVESAWKGSNGAWEKKISNTSKEIIDLVGLCAEKNIPTIFWAKEDPVHFSTFLNTAKLFDYVFTTDAGSVPKYRGLTNKETVYLLPFGVQPKNHNPVEKMQRKDAFCFAGTFYSNYVERANDFDTLFNTLSKILPFDIFDRYHLSGLTDYKFPEKYSPFIKGYLSSNNLDMAYMGYNFGVNLNTIKQSQTMFSRRVFELLASGTLVVSNYSYGMRLFFGDLVISSDNSNELHKKVGKLISDSEYRDKIRIAGIRSILADHKCSDRLNHICQAVYGDSIANGPPRVLVISIIEREDDFDKLFECYRRQKYPNKRLFIFTNLPLPSEVPDNTSVAPLANNHGLCIEFFQEDCLAYFHPCDYYGCNYLVDMMNALMYQELRFITKSSKFVQNGGNAFVTDPGHEFTVVENAQWHNSLVPLDQISSLSISDFIERVKDGKIEQKCFSIDRFNYCKNGSLGCSSRVDDDFNLNTGVQLESIYKSVEKNYKKSCLRPPLYYTGRQLKRLLCGKVSASVDFSDSEGDSSIKIIKKNNKPEVIRFIEDLEINNYINNNVLKIFFDADRDKNYFLRINIINHNENIEMDIQLGSGESTEIPILNNDARIRFSLVLIAPLSKIIRGLRIGEYDAERYDLLGKGHYLVITNNYPSYSDYYKNSFIHSRIKAYINEGIQVDIVKFGPKFEKQFYEFDGADVISTNDIKELHTIIQSNNYRKLIIHFLNPDVWEVVKHYADKMKVLIWVHGSEIQPYHRREFNFKDEKQRIRAMEQSEIRTKFWKQLFSMKNPNIHFIFVSRYFVEEVSADLGITLDDWQYSIIHNFIDTEKFEFLERAADDRLHILSIRSFASKKYANDITVQAIRELSRRPFFSKLSFTIIGDGVLFDETIRPLKGYTNVRLIKKFLPIDEYMSIFQQNGILVIPTRWDSQGVTRDEAMSTGMVVITNPIAAVPEFVDDDSGLLVKPEDGVAIADAIENLYFNPDLFSRISQGAATRVRRQNGYVNTIKNEINIIKGD